MFHYGKGAVMHFVSHLKAQRNEYRDVRDRGSAQDFATMTNTVVMPGVRKDATVAGLETGYSTVSTVVGIMTEKVGDLTRKTPSGGKSFLLELIVKEYPNVYFIGAYSIKTKKQDYAKVVYDLIESPVAIGRGGHNHVDLRDDKVSRNHAKIVYDGKNCYLEDLNSTNGTFLNGKKIANKVYLKGNEKFGIGSGTIEFKLKN